MDFGDENWVGLSGIDYIVLADKNLGVLAIKILVHVVGWNFDILVWTD